MSEQADPRNPVEPLHGGEADEFIGEEVAWESNAGFEGEHGERGEHLSSRAGDEFLGEEVAMRDSRGGFEGEHGERGERPEGQDDAGPM